MDAVMTDVGINTGTSPSLSRLGQLLSSEKADAVRDVDDDKNPLDQDHSRPNKYQPLFESLPNADAFGTVTLGRAKDSLYVVVNAVNGVLNRPVKDKTANEETLNALNEKVNGNNHPTTESKSKADLISLSPNLLNSQSSFEGLPMQTLIDAIKQLMMHASFAIQDNLSAIFKDLSANREELTKQEMKKYAKWLQESIDEQQKAHRASIFNVGLNVAFAVGSIALGIFLIAGSPLGGGPLAVAGGLMAIGAGLAGLVKSGYGAAAIFEQDKGNTKKAEEYEQDAAIAGYVEMGFDIAACLIIGVEVAVKTFAKRAAVGKAVEKGVNAATASRTASRAGEIEAVELREIGSGGSTERAANRLQSGATKAEAEMVQTLEQEAIEEAVEKGVNVATASRTASRAGKIEAVELREIGSGSSTESAANHLKSGSTKAEAEMVQTLEQEAIEKLAESMVKEIRQINPASLEAAAQNGLEGWTKIWQKIAPKSLINWDRVADISQTEMKAVIKDAVKYPLKASRAKLASKVTNRLIFEHLKTSIFQSKGIQLLRISAMVKCAQEAGDGVLKWQLNKSRYLINKLAAEIKLIQQLLQRFNQQAMKEKQQALKSNARMLADGFEDVTLWLKQLAQTLQNAARAMGPAH